MTAGKSAGRINCSLSTAASVRREFTASISHSAPFSGYYYCGLIKANIPSRIAFTVSSKNRLAHYFVDQGGAESLLGMGDMLYAPNGYMPERVHGAFCQR